jgi:hypothetical protein
LCVKGDIQSSVLLAAVLQSINFVVKAQQCQ